MTNTLTGLLHYLVQDGLLIPQEAEAVAKSSAEQAMTITQYLVQNGVIASQPLLQYCARRFGIPIFDLSQYQKIWLTESLIKPELIFHYRVLPLNRDQHYLYLGITDPTNQNIIATIGFYTGMRIQPMLVDEHELNKLITEHYKTNIQTELQLSLSKMKINEPSIVETIAAKEFTDDEDNEEPIIEFVGSLLKDAIEKQISDIHIEPFNELYRIRFRRDGFLYQAHQLPKNLAVRVVTRLKILANMNIAERRLPQDGRIHFNRSDYQGKSSCMNIDIRINTCPTLFGEKIVLRLLDPVNVNLDINHLGFSATQQAIFLAQIEQPQGLILVTGPTGSGKTTTLYSALHYLNKIEKNITSVEDPVEIELTGINQINIAPNIGLGFATVLRAILRQDPDIVMIGEIRDLTTAEIAMQAAQTGHLVLSTLHTNSAIDTISRLSAMEIPPYHLTSSVSLIIAQRLMRKKCLLCATVQHQNGCEDCYQGYKGRIGVFELLLMTPELEEIILSGAKMNAILNHAKTHGYKELAECAAEKLSLGITSEAEIKRVLGV